MENTIYYYGDDPHSIIYFKLKKGTGIIKNIKSYLKAAF